MSKIKLNNITLVGLDGNKQTVDISKDIANAIYFKAQTLEVVEAMRDLYKTGECEHSELVADHIRAASEQMFGIVVRTAIEECLKA